MGSALRGKFRYVRVYLRIALGPFEIESPFFGKSFEFRPLPLWEPSLGIGISSRILGVKTFWILYLFVASLWHEDLSSSVSLGLHHLRLLVASFISLGYGRFKQSLYIIWVLVSLGLVQSLLEPIRFIDILVGKEFKKLCGDSLI